ncbi:PepSY-associated TM helix domain-containing protein [Arachidicoccus ginsenosidivorans]|uniref:PepSY-associated TM helix domain-containing protein n=1 Tax=Arachidicoccus ginsenosidivorans TaxID=496057 RepID=UPI001CEF92B1|nr:PepSY-associated TM helix domain-containing protein [Arachidicoccus ginsenosidivorans]
MNLRNYNIYFHTHTISGIIISLILYVIFFAGSFAFFKAEITNWQKDTPNAVVQKQNIDMNRVRDTMAGSMNLYGRDLYISLNERTRKMVVSATASKDTTVKGRGGYYYMDAATFNMKDYRKDYDLGEFLYRLHFLAPLNVIGGRGFPFGYYVAGLVAFLFLFAIITGVLVHWKKIVSNFYVFRPWEKLKTLWTDLHTALGVITLPFLFVFAVTGAYYLISYPLVSQPVAAAQYGGSTDSLFKATSASTVAYDFLYRPTEKAPDLNALYLDAQTRMKHTHVTSLVVSNYGDASMHITINGANQHKNFTGTASVVYNGATSAVEKFTPIDGPASYSKAVDNLMYTLHFGNFGGIWSEYCISYWV